MSIPNYEKTGPVIKPDEYLKLKNEMPTIGMRVVFDEQNKPKKYLPNPADVTRVADYITKHGEKGKILRLKLTGEHIATNGLPLELPPIESQGRKNGSKEFMSKKEEADFHAWLIEVRGHGAIPSLPEPEVEIYSNIYLNQIDDKVLSETVMKNALQSVESGSRKNLTRKELAKFVQSMGIIEGVKTNPTSGKEEVDLVKLFEKDKDIGNPKVFSNTVIAIDKAMEEKGYTSPGREFVTGAALHVNLFQQNRSILFNKDGTYKVETEVDWFNKNTDPKKQAERRLADAEWTDTLRQMYTQDIHQNPSFLTRAILAVGRHEYLKKENRTASHENENVIANIEGQLEGRVPHDPKNISRLEEIEKSNLSPLEKSFLSLTYAIKNDVKTTTEIEQKKYVDGAIKAGNSISDRERIANLGPDNFVSTLYHYAPLFVGTGIAWLLMKCFSKKNDGFVAGIRKILGGLTIFGLVTFGLTGGTKMLAPDKKSGALGAPKMPEKTPTLIEKKGKQIDQWRAQWENGTTWTEIVNDIPELRDPNTPTDTPQGKGLAIGNIIAAIYPHDRNQQDLATSSEELARAKELIKDLQVSHGIESENLKTMVSEVWDSLKWDRGTGFQAANEKTAAFGNVAEAVDKKEGFFVRALRSVTGGQIERKMFATYMRNQKWLENQKIGDVLHTLNSNNFSGGWSAFISQPFISASNWSPKAWKIDTKNIKGTPLTVPNNLHNHPIDFIHLRVLINTIWNKRGNTVTDQTLIKDAINMNTSEG